MSGSNTVYENLDHFVSAFLGLAALSLLCGYCFGRAFSGTGTCVLLKRKKEVVGSLKDVMHIHIMPSHGIGSI